ALDGEFVTVHADERPHRAGLRRPQPRLAAEEAVLALEVLRFALPGLVPRLAAVRGAPHEVRPVPAVVIDAEQERAVGELEHVARRVVGRLRLDPLRLDADRVPGLAPV